MNLRQEWAWIYAGLAAIEFVARPEVRAPRWLWIVGSALALAWVPGLWGFVLFWALLNAPLARALLERSRREGQPQGGLYLLVTAVTIAFLVKLALASRPLASLPGWTALALAVTGGLFPFHVCAHDALASLRPSERKFFAAAQPGWLLFIRLGHEISGVEFLLLPWIALSAVYRAGTCLAEGDFERALESLFASLGCGVLLGVVSGRLGVAGAGVAMGVWLLGHHGVMGLFSHLRAHFRLAGIRSFEGLAQVAPRAQVLFLVLGLISVGVPIGLGFIGEDLLVHALFENGFALGVTYIVATALSVLGFFRIYAHLFAGLCSAPGQRADAGRWALAFYGLLAACLVLAGLCPDLVLKHFK